MSNDLEKRLEEIEASIAGFVYGHSEDIKFLLSELRKHMKVTSAVEETLCIETPRAVQVALANLTPQDEADG